MAIPSINLSDQTADIRLLILLAKTRLSTNEAAAAKELVASVIDWCGFADLGQRNFNLPLIRRHLRAIDDGTVPATFWERVDPAANQVAYQNMRMILAQKKFVETVTAPLGYDALFFKGPSMAAQFYPDVGLRPCRDVDALIPKGSLRPIINKCLAEGYLPVAPDGKATPLTSKRDINAILRFNDSVTMIAPEGIVIDLQDHLDKHSGMFNSLNLFDEADSFEIAGTTFSTLPLTFLFNYLCHHHTRHTWSRLHWLSDLDAICSSEHFDRDVAVALAEELGQRGTVEGCLELYTLISTDTPWSDTSEMHRGKSLLKLCILNLPGNLALEKQLGLRMMGGEFMYHWQARPELVAQARRGWWRTIFRPTLSQYVSYPLPEMLQWLYFIPRAFELFQRTRQRLRPVKR
ncbi:hypothetical protein DSM14862_04078 (plasmid) [Sulfitobacter indolifex]|uniref:Nucleotidyltransferase family protein n=1 Tax=Sulfitobacter indolifex HEL-45 TaxID=391624 RepID=A0ABM9X1U9_9RHOB|nr:nucleotidyltransferase family protein [Sulfitobacter indolifex]EDQ03417.1 hypothetical protein OIHEL45_16911 [Sulfitobacter indolifex HEL-45]UOA21238.1 hypothetical protein DSM14862_04078 [Sulfitobacter indolifex]